MGKAVVTKMTGLSGSGLLSKLYYFFFGTPVTRVVQVAHQYLPPFAPNTSGIGDRGEQKRLSVGLRRGMA
jgi:hypothetical protein